MEAIDLTRRDLVAATLLAVAASACGSTPSPEEDVATIHGRLDERLAQFASDEEEAARFSALLLTLREDAQAFLEEHTSFTESLVDGSRDRGVDSAALKSLLDGNVVERDRLRSRLLEDQQALKVALGPDRWAELVDGLNDPETMLRIVGRRS